MKQYHLLSLSFQMRAWDAKRLLARSYVVENRYVMTYRSAMTSYNGSRVCYESYTISRGLEVMHGDAESRIYINGDITVHYIVQYNLGCPHVVHKFVSQFYSPYRVI